MVISVVGRLAFAGCGRLPALAGLGPRAGPRVAAPATQDLLKRARKVYPKPHSERGRRALGLCRLPRRYGGRPAAFRPLRRRSGVISLRSHPTRRPAFAGPLGRSPARVQPACRALARPRRRSEFWDRLQVVYQMIRLRAAAIGSGWTADTQNGEPIEKRNTRVSSSSSFLSGNPR